MDDNLKEKARKGVIELVEKFQAAESYYLDPSFDEANCKQIFITEFFKELGWDVYSKKPLPPFKREVWLEDTVEQGDTLKRVDYAFTINSEIKFFVEAKAPHVNLEGKKPIFQVKEYAWNAKVPIGILTDFQEFKVFDCRHVPNFDNPRMGLVKELSCKYTEFPEKFDKIYDTLSYEAVFDGSLNKFLKKNESRTKGFEVDNLFLKDLSKWRLDLAKNIFELNPEITEQVLNRNVQRILDKLVFIRIIEDRDIEPTRLLEPLVGQQSIFELLTEIFQKLDLDYNGNLFHEDESYKLKVSDSSIEAIIKELYPKFNLATYRFDVIRVEILGQIYERFLGEQLVIDGKEVTLEYKPATKKAGGIFYTPKYIVDHVVEKTIGQLIDGKTPRQIEKLSFVDPSCGSGSFLLGVYDYLIKYHGNYYRENPSKSEGVDWYKADQGKVNLTTKKKREILLNNIYGVDLDDQAVEVTQFSLYIKLLERENSSTVSQQFSLFKIAHLPDLTKNIVFGNSLIEEGDKNSLHWRNTFPKIFEKDGFDVAVGNPPWGAELNEKQLGYLRSKHVRVVDRMIDSYIYFISHTLNIISEKGVLGFVVPSTILNQVDTQAVRKLLIEEGVSELISLGEKVFGPKVLNTTTVFITNPKKNSKSKISLLDLREVKTENKGLFIKTGQAVNYGQWSKVVSQDPHNTFFLDNIAATSILFDMRNQHDLLEDYLEGKIARGVSPDSVESHVISSDLVDREKIESEILREGLSGAQIKNYSKHVSDQFVIYATRDTNIESFPNTYKWLKQFQATSTCSEVSSGKHPYWSLHRPRKEEIFKSPKIIGLTTSKKIELIFDEDDDYFVTDAMYLFKAKAGVDEKALVQIMRSRVFLFLYRVANAGGSRVIPQVKAAKLHSIPVPRSIESEPEELIRFYENLSAFSEDGNTEKFEDEIEEFNKYCYQLYGLKKEEIKVVEEYL